METTANRVLLALADHPAPLGAHVRGLLLPLNALRLALTVALDLKASGFAHALAGTGGVELTSALVVSGPCSPDPARRPQRALAAHGG
ncbi:MAG: hypothetical protein IPL96_17605 [Holophagaceae bacterium]|nr:hypothetical protein [Holophagaceae bacterium]